LLRYGNIKNVSTFLTGLRPSVFLPTHPTAINRAIFYFLLSIKKLSTFVAFYFHNIQYSNYRLHCQGKL
jgi:hypothetical protein